MPEGRAISRRAIALFRAPRHRHIAQRREYVIGLEGARRLDAVVAPAEPVILGEDFFRRRIGEADLTGVIGDQRADRHIVEDALRQFPIERTLVDRPRETFGIRHVMDEATELDHLGRRKRRASGRALDVDLAIFAADFREIGAEAMADALLGEERTLEAAILEERIAAIVMRDEDALGMGALEKAAPRIDRAPARTIERREIRRERTGHDEVSHRVVFFVPDQIDRASCIERLRQHAETAAPCGRLDRCVVQRSDCVVAQDFVVINSCHVRAVPELTSIRRNRKQRLVTLTLT